MHAKFGLGMFLKWKIFRPDSVIAAVIQLGMLRTDWLRFAYCKNVETKNHA